MDELQARRIYALNKVANFGPEWYRGRMDLIECDVRDAYLSILGREPDPSGFEAYTRLLRDKKISAIELRAQFLFSDEYRAKRGIGAEQHEERSLINDLVVLYTNQIVQSGPFVGLQLIDTSARGDGDIAPKLLGTYEQDLHPFIEQFAANHYSAIVDVGCAEGYYAVGLSRLCPHTPILAFDNDAQALDITAKTAALNGRIDAIQFGEFCDPVRLKAVFERYGRCLVVVDCEGYEKHLFSDASTNFAGRCSDLIIECHDLWDSTITPSLISSLAESHDIMTIPAGGRNPNTFPFLQKLSEWDRWRAVWERRGAMQHWLVCKAKRF